MGAATLSLHGANRALERDVPLEALEGTKLMTPLLNEKPLKFRFKGIVIVARMAGCCPRIITAWKGVM